MRNTISLIIIVLVTVVIGHAQRAKSALLPTSEAKALANQCSRESPEDFTDTWVPSADQIREMESRLGAISNLRAKECCMIGDTVEDPGKWYLQYVGLVWKGKKIIYISAVSRKPPTQFRIDPANNIAEEVPTDSWKTRAVVICDGGTNWGVIYDPASRKFSHLAVNGVG